MSKFTKKLFVDAAEFDIDEILKEVSIREERVDYCTPDFTELFPVELDSLSGVRL